MRDATKSFLSAPYLLTISSQLGWASRVNWRISSDMDGNSAVRFDSDANDNRAMDYIYSAVTEARDNFRDLINMEELKEMARARVDAALEAGEAPDEKKDASEVIYIDKDHLHAVEQDMNPAQ